MNGSLNIFRIEKNGTSHRNDEPPSRVQLVEELGWELPCCRRDEDAVESLLRYAEPAPGFLDPRIQKRVLGEISLSEHHELRHDLESCHMSGISDQRREQCGRPARPRSDIENGISRHRT